MFCAVALPGARGQAVLTGMLLAILVAACAALALGGNEAERLALARRLRERP